MFIIMIVGAVIGYSQSFNEIKGALHTSMGKFKEGSTDDKAEQAITEAWNNVQRDVSL